MRTLFAMAMLFLVSVPAIAHWKPEYAQLPQEVQDWYANAQLTPEAQQRLNFKSCCAHADVKRTKFRVNSVDGSDQWEWLDRFGEWQIVPPDIVETGKSAPDGQPTLFAVGRICRPVFSLLTAESECAFASVNGSSA